MFLTCIIVNRFKIQWCDPNKGTERDNLFPFVKLHSDMKLNVI